MKPRGRRPSAGAPKEDPSPLRGRLRDQAGDRLTPTHTQRYGKRFRYYVSHRLINGPADPTGWRIPAPALETTIAGLIADHIAAAVTSLGLKAHLDLRDAGNPDIDAKLVIARLQRGEPAALRNLLLSGTIQHDGLRLELDTAALAREIGLVESDLAQGLGEINASLHLRRRGIEAKLIIGTPAPRPDPVLLKALGAAHRWMEELRSGETLRAIASRAGLDEAVLRKRGQLAFLSSLIQAAVLSGTQPCTLTLERMIQDPPPLDWNDQERLYGFFG